MNLRDPYIDCDGSLRLPRIKTRKKKSNTRQLIATVISDAVAGTPYPAFPNRMRRSLAKIASFPLRRDCSLTEATRPKFFPPLPWIVTKFAPPQATGFEFPHQSFDLLAALPLPNANLADFSHA